MRGIIFFLAVANMSVAHAVDSRLPLDILQKGVSSRSSVKSLGSGRVSVGVYHKQKLLGSATRLCLNNKSPLSDRPWNFTFRDRKLRQLWTHLPSGKTWYATAAHVVGQLSSLQTSLGSLRVEFVDVESDFALLSASSHSGTPLACALLAESLYFPMVFDAQSLIWHAPSSVEIDSASPISGATQLWSAQTYLGASYLSGTQRYPTTGPLIVMVGDAIPGQSGGAVFAKPDLWGKTGIGDRQEESILESDRSYRRLLGIILSTRRTGNEIALLSARRIQQLLLEYFSGESRRGQVPGFAKATDGFEDVGTGNLVENGTGNLGDIGTGNLVDNGSGNLGDIAATELRAEPVQFHPSYRVYNNGLRWSEFEAMPSNVSSRQVQKDVQKVDILNGEIRSSLKSLENYQWFSMADLFYADIFDLVGVLRTVGRRSPFRIESKKNCRTLLSVLRSSRARNVEAVGVQLCEVANERQSTVTLSAFKAQKKTPFLSLRGTLSQSLDSQLKAELEINAGSFSRRLSPSNSLRHWQHDNLDVMLERRAGYQIVFKDEGVSFRLSGPSFASPFYPAHPWFIDNSQ